MCQKTAQAQALGGRRGERRETMRGACCETRAVCTTADRPTVPIRTIVHDLAQVNWLEIVTRKLYTEASSTVCQCT